MPTTLRRALLPAFLALALPLAACVRESDENTNEGTDASPGATVVEVELTDGSVEMPGEIPAGPVHFEVTNSGTVPHGFAIDGVDDALDDLLPDQLETLFTELEAATYVVYSPGRRPRGRTRARAHSRPRRGRRCNPAAPRRRGRPERGAGADRGRRRRLADDRPAFSRRSARPPPRRGRR